MWFCPHGITHKTPFLKSQTITPYCSLINSATSERERGQKPRLAHSLPKLLALVTRVSCDYAKTTNKPR
jgi:hypothetical protein